MSQACLLDLRRLLRPKCMNLAISQVHMTLVWHIYQTQGIWTWCTYKSKVRGLGRITKSLKTPTKTYMTLGRIFVLVGFQVFCGLFGSWWPWIGLTRSLGVLGQK